MSRNFLTIKLLRSLLGDCFSQKLESKSGIQPPDLVDKNIQIFGYSQVSNFIHLDKTMNVIRLTTFGLLSTLLVTAPTFAATQKPTLPNTSANNVLNVERQSGACPKTIGLWTTALPYEGGAEFTVIADTLRIAGFAKLVASSEKFAEYKAPLKKAYASCVGSARDQEVGYYQVRLKKGYLFFRVELPKDTPSKPSGISATGIVSSRPYVRWQLAD